MTHLSWLWLQVSCTKLVSLQLSHYLWYLLIQALHEKGAANTDHTTLLLNCYTKLKDVQKLDEFIKVGMF